MSNKDARTGRLETLLAEYTAHRDDERQYFVVQATLISVGLAAVSLLALFITNDCRYGGEAECAGPYTPNVVMATLPLIPMALIGYITVIGNQASIRSLTLRALEREIRAELARQGFETRLVAGRFETAEYQDIDRPGTARMWLASVTEIEASLGSLSRGARPARQILSIAFAVVALFYVGITLAAAWFVSPAWKLVMLTVYGAAFVIIFRSVLAGTVGARKLFADVLEDADGRIREDRLRPESARVDRSRSTLLRYLVYPRPSDWSKATFFPLGFLLASVSSWDSTPLDPWVYVRGALLWFTIEFLIYQARYQLNDLRGVSEDNQHPLRESRRRIPIPAGDSRAGSRVVRLSLYTVAARLWVTVIVATIAVPFGPGATAVFVAALAVLGTALAYDTLRERGKGKASAWALYLLVGTGYAVRGIAGYWAGSGTQTHVLGDWGGVLGYLIRPDVLWLAIYLSLFGSTFVVLTWILEAGSYSLDSLDPLPPVRAEIRHLDAIHRRVHLVELIRGLGLKLTPPGDPEPPERFGDLRTRGSDSGILRSGDRRIGPQSVLTVAASASAGMAAVGLVADPSHGAVALSTKLAGALALLGALITFLPKWWRVPPAVAGFFLVLWTTGTLAPPGGVVAVVASGVPWALLAATVVAFRRESYYGLRHGFDGLGRAVAAISAYALRRCIGDAAGGLMGLPSRDDLAAGSLWKRISDAAGLVFHDFESARDFTYRIVVRGGQGSAIEFSTGDTVHYSEFRAVVDSQRSALQGSRSLRSRGMRLTGCVLDCLDSVGSGSNVPRHWQPDGEPKIQWAGDHQ